MKLANVLCKLTCGSMLAFVSASVQAEVIFKESFDSQPDFTSTMHSTQGSKRSREGDILPEGWDSLYNGTRWSPETGYANNHASLEILSRNRDKARGGTGKSAVMWRESYDDGWKNWASDSQLIKFLPKEYKQLYLEFYIKYSDNWWHREGRGNWTSKMLRIGYFDGKGNEFSPSKGHAGPVFFYNYQVSDYGLRRKYVLTGDHLGGNYNGVPGKDRSLNYSNHLENAAPDGGRAILFDKMTGNPLPRKGFIGHDQIFGSGSEWTKIAFYVRMNSAPGVEDGVLRHWVDNVQVENSTNIVWVGENPDNEMVGWNYFSIGGNDYFQPRPNSERFEDWYSIDDILVISGLPNSPAAPISINVE